MILATGMYKLQFWVPEGRSYHGDLIGSGRDPRRPWRAGPGASLAVAGDCAQGVFGWTVSNWSPWRGRSRSASAVMPTRSHAIGRRTAAEHRIRRQADARVSSVLQRYPLDLRPFIPSIKPPVTRTGLPQLWIIDPHGNLVLRYDPSVKGKDLLNDLRHLLKLSNIG